MGCRSADFGDYFAYALAKERSGPVSTENFIRIRAGLGYRYTGARLTRLNEPTYTLQAEIGY